MEMFGTYQVTSNLLVIRTPDVCQLNCKYCFRQYNEQFQTILYKPEQILDLLNRFPQIKAITFLGGEPLIYFSFIKNVIDLTKSKIKKFCVTTNSLLLNEEMILFFVENHCQINISIDGPKEVNDFNRGEGTFDLVMDKIALLKKIAPYRYFWVISATFNADTISKLYESYLFFRVIQPKALAINIDRIGSWSKEELKIIEEQLRKIKQHYLANNKVIKILFERIFINNILYNHVNDLFLHPNGDIFQSTLFSKDKLGNPKNKLPYLGNINNLINCKDWTYFYPTVERICYNFDSNKCSNCKLGNRIYDESMDKHHGELFCTIYHSFIDNLEDK